MPGPRHEDLNVEGMVRNRHLAKSISDAAMGEPSSDLYKARWHCVEVRVADRFFPSSKTCSGCGEVRKDLDLSARTYSCEVCGLVIDRDLNAAINLARWQPKEPSEVTLLNPTPALLLSTADPLGCTAKHAGRAEPHNHMSTREGGNEKRKGKGGSKRSKREGKGERV